MWIFGYGSLTWKVDFPYEEKLVGYIEGCKRRFYQHSTDHRGTPENPGRVVTLIPGDESDRVYGVAYRISETQEQSVLDHLDYREKGGYERVNKTFFPGDPNVAPFEIIIYVAHLDNKQFAGEADEDAIARQIVNAVGPSGPNVDYVRRLADRMREIAPDVDDSHLFNIEEKVANLTEHT